jgi:hypothetical protein
MIFETNESFPFDRLTLLTPKPIPGGNHFSRFHIDDSPIFIHLPKCSTKQGIQTSGTKKAYTDLQFTNDQERFLKWLETLTEKVQEIVFDNSTTWFANEMDKAEIEETFQSPLKPFRSGQQYLMRVNVPIRLGKITLPIFDENENPVESQMVKTGGHILGVLEIQGLKFSQKSLQLEMEMKQILLLPSSSIFEKCILSTSAQHSSNKKSSTAPAVETTPLPPIKTEILETVEIQPLAIETNPENKLENKPEDTTAKEEEEAITMNLDDISDPEPEIQDSPQKNPETPPPPPEDELQDVDICLENMTLQPIDTTVQLKNSKEIYYKMYRQARQKAKLARDLAISSYLESKHIKNIYVLEDLSDDEDEVSFFTVDSQWQKKKLDQNN